MRAQRVREGESRVEMQVAKWTAEGTGKGFCLVFCDVRHTSVAGNMQVFRKVHGSFRESGWHRGRILTLVLDRSRILSWAGFFIMTVKGVPLARNNCLSFFQNQKRR